MTSTLLLCILDTSISGYHRLTQEVRVSRRYTKYFGSKISALPVLRIYNCQLENFANISVQTSAFLTQDNVVYNHPTKYRTVVVFCSIPINCIRCGGYENRLPAVDYRCRQCDCYQLPRRLFHRSLKMEGTKSGEKVNPATMTMSRGKWWKLRHPVEILR